MTLRNSSIVLVVGAIITCGCGAGPPTTPTPLPSVFGTTAAPPLQPLHVVGRVLDGANGSVAGARLTPWDQPSYSGVSGADGTFELTVPIKAQDRTFWITVEKAGYETSELARSVDGAASTLLRLHEIRRIAAGESARTIVSPDDSACGYHWGYLCRRVRVRAQSSGTLTLELVSDSALGIPMGPVGFVQSLEKRVSIPVKGDAEVSVEVASGLPLSAPADFTLNTSLTP